MSLKVKSLIKIISIILLVIVICVITLAYLKYQDLKKALITKMEVEATSFIGQKVVIDDISIGANGINIHDISVKNPEEFTPGELLKIKKLHLNMKYRELVNKKFHSKKIIVYGPELTLIKDREGRFNISEKMRNFFKRRPTITYQIDDFEIRSGSIDFNKVFKTEKIDIHIKNLSSNAGIKTSIKGNTLFAGNNKLSFEGWAYLKDDPKRLNITVTSEDINLSLFKQFFDKYGINTVKTKSSFYLNTSGDTSKGLDIKSELKFREVGFVFFKKDAKEILLDISAFFSIQNNLLSIENCSLHSDNVTAATLKGEIKKENKDFVFNIWPKIRKLDLSAFNFMKNIRIEGMITSENILIHGRVKKHFPEISGTVKLRDGVLKSKGTDIGAINSRLTFIPGRQAAGVVKTTARIFSLKGHAVNASADTNFKFTTKENFQDIVFASIIKLTPVEINIEKEKKVQAECLALNVKGNIKGRKFSVEGLADIKDVKYNKFKIPQLHTEFLINNSGENFVLRNLNIEGNDFKLSSELLTVNFPEKGKMNRATIKIKKLNADYPVKKSEIKDTDLFLNINIGKNLISGDLDFFINRITFSAMHIVFIKGSGKIDNKNLLLEIPKAEVFRGNVMLKAEGKISESPFPIKIVLDAENIDLDKLSVEVMKNIEMPYKVSGVLKNVIFDGILQNDGSIEGNAKIIAENIEVLDKNTKTILKDFVLTGESKFKGEDLNFIIVTSGERISAEISGTLKKFTQKDRLLEMKIAHPEVKLTDIRETFWEVFPDSLLYAELGGSFSSELFLKYTTSSLQLDGRLKLNNIVLEGENREYYIGPVNGIIPIEYKRPSEKFIKDMPLFERSEFNNLKKYFSREISDSTYSRIKIGTLMYGFKLLDNISIWLKQEGNIFNVEQFSADIFGGKIQGSALFDISNGYNYRVGAILKGIKLSTLCDEITPIRGYLSGMVDGLIHLKGTKGGISKILGKTDFWTYSTNKEKTKLSREFLKKVGGQSIKSYLGDRNFDKGIMNLYVKNGFLIFNEFEISNKNFFGFNDLLIKVAPFNNRIAIDDLMWTITEAANRAKKEKN